MKDKKILLIPFLILAISLMIDRFLTNNYFERYYSNTLSHLNYLSKQDLYEDLKGYLKKPPSERKKVLVFLGNSRSLLFPYHELREKYPDWILYNFSVPGGSPDYFLYWVERITKDGLHPDFIVLDESLEIFNKTPNLALDEVLIYGVSPGFLLRHWNRYSKEQWSIFLSKRMFHSYRDRPKLWRVRERLKNDSYWANNYAAAVVNTLESLADQKGSTSREANVIKLPQDQLIKRSESDFQSYLSPYTFHYDMLEMQRDSVELLKKAGIPYATIWVRVARPYFKLYGTRKTDTPDGPQIPLNVWLAEIRKFNQETDTKFWDMNNDPEYTCDDFSDPGHMSPSCYPAYGDYVFRKLSENVEPN
ncbi:PF07611 family protein [Leptospira fainei serovar Hurstbridge str. BUT 6]|uniref:PF07611 family protein n=1 Tax=Leptospira fainei serovar Hurstbridge str. BUT 6 TaxID=1193011 RepID=S3V534_9LEPT|nr:DUF1574 domain-containing protein [Leptospira fainei]EPG75739.1 PF07611 family protein [Leptospira fainei serovar Hurstbridge str. BUT 6]